MSREILHSPGLIERGNFESLLQACSHLDSAGITKVRLAVAVAYNAHYPQMRESGQMYINHPLRVGRMLAQMNLDADTISAGLLHDVPEDSADNGRPVTADDLTRLFGERVRNIALGCRNSEWDIKIDVQNLPGYKKEMTPPELKELENREYAIRTGLKILKNFSSEENSYPQVVLIKLADTLDNQREPKAKPRRRAVKAEEVLKVRANLARFIGEHFWRNEMSTLAFEAYNPEMFYNILQALFAETGLDQSLYRPDDINRFQTIQQAFKKTYSLPDTEQKFTEVASQVFGAKTKVVAGYPGLYALFRSWEKEMQSNDQSTPVFTKNDLYLKVAVVLPDELANEPNGQVKSQARKLIGQFKSSGYTVEEPAGNHRERNFFYVRDPRQNQRFRVRVVSQRRYDHDIARVADLYRTNALPDEREKAKAKLRLLNENYLRLQQAKEGGDAGEILATLIDHLDGGMRVISPTGKETPLRHGATVLDYAYLILGTGMVRLTGIFINGQTNSIKDINHVLEDGDQVQLVWLGGIQPENTHISPVSPKWLTGQSNPHVIAIVSEQLRENLNYYEAHNDTRAASWRKELVDIGLGILRPRLPNGFSNPVSNDVLIYIKQIEGRNGYKYENIEEFLLGLAFGEIYEKDVEEISKLSSKAV